MRCGRCGNENGAANRFCGMCGAALVATGQAVGQSRGPAATPSAASTSPAGLTPAGKVGAPAQPAVSGQPAAAPPAAARGSQAQPAPAPRPAELDRVAERPPAPISRSEDEHGTGPVITGHSFLGLNSPGPVAGGGRDGFRDDRHADRHVETGRDPLRPSSNLDYLLEDDEEESAGRGWGKLILLAAAVALAAGFGYLHWKQGGFDWLNARDQKPAAITKQTPDAAQNGATAGSGVTTDAGTPPAGGVSTAPPANGTNPAEPAGVQATAPQTGPQGTVEQSTPSQPASVQPQTADPNLPAGSASQPAAAVSGGEAAPAEETPKEPRKPAAMKPVAKPVDTVTEAERFIYGRGVKRDCDHGLRLLKPAAAQSNPKAMISMGALYSTGVCTPRDLPTAYRWLALALHKQPDNQALQDNLQKLWAQMTQPERQLAIKLSQ